jgi:ribonuclease HI
VPRRPLPVDTIDETAINIYTDGSSYSHPRMGGVGIVFVTVDDAGNEVVEEYALLGYQSATNQQMELQACIEALDALLRHKTTVDLKDYKKILIHTDSMYVVTNWESALFHWPTTDWLTRDGTPVANAPQWKTLVAKFFATRARVRFTWVKGHKASAHNKTADRLAKGSARSALRPPLSVVTVRRKLTDRSVVVGSVDTAGRRLTVRIITAEWLSVQKMNKYKYEVMSKRSPSHGLVDLAYSSRTVPLRAGHTYYVIFGTGAHTRDIVHLIREIGAVRDVPASRDEPTPDDQR